MQDYTAYAVLDGLPPLVRKQRRLEAQILPLSQLVEEEKKLRGDIDALLIKAGIANNDGVTCLGYDVAHHERKGQSRINEAMLIEQLVTHGIDRPVALKILVESTETGEPSAWATVKPAKGSKVRVS